MEDIADTFGTENLRNLTLNVLALSKDAPAQLHTILSDLAENRLTVRTIVAEDSRVQRSRNRRTRVISMSVVTVGIALIASNVRMSEPFGNAVMWVSYVALAALYVAIAVHWRACDERFDVDRRRPAIANLITAFADGASAVCLLLSGTFRFRGGHTNDSENDFPEPRSGTSAVSFALHSAREPIRKL